MSANSRFGPRVTGVLVSLLLIGMFVPDPRAMGQDVFFRPALKSADITAGLSTDWFGLYIKGKKNGYFKTTREKVGDTIVESFILNMKVVSMDIKAEIKISQSLTFEDQPPYRLLKGVFQQDDGANKILITATRTGDKTFAHVVEVGGQKRMRTVNDLDYTLSDSMASEFWLRSAPKEGDKILGKDLDMQEWKSDQTRYTLAAIKSALVGGVDVKFYEVESESKKEMIKLLSRNDAKGNMLQGTIGGLFELRKETEAQAKNTEYSQDLFVLGQAKIDRKIGYPTRLTELVLEVKGKVGEILENGPRQTITLEKPGRSPGQDRQEVRQRDQGHGQGNRGKPGRDELVCHQGPEGDRPGQKGGRRSAKTAEEKVGEHRHLRARLHPGRPGGHAAQHSRPDREEARAIASRTP